MKDSNVEIIMKNPGWLVAYAFNPKDHPDDQVDAIATSIKLFGFNNPVIIDKDNVVVAWHWRLLASKKLWMEKIPCIVVWHLTEDELRAYRIADNKLAEMGKTNFENLKIEVEAINIPFINEIIPIRVDAGWQLDLSWIQNVDFWSDDDSEDHQEENNDANIRWYSIKYEIIFDNEDQKDKFYKFMTYLENNCQGETIAERLTTHIEEFIS